ncbi:MAG: hypothetical protein M0006_08865 [Magnetospirillum sp.]|nr:hypothetical protein [Magnetospirillum sp.]
MLVKGAHLLPDSTGALVWPRHGLIAASDPVATGGRDPASVTAALHGLARMLKRRRPAVIVWIGGGLAGAVAAGRLAGREAAELSRMVAAHRWIWVGDDLPDGLPGQSAAEWPVGPLTFRAAARRDAAAGEISATPWPTATIRAADRMLTCPCYVVDGRRLLLPAFGPRPGGVDVCSAPVQTLFRRPFQALLLSDGRILTRSRPQLAAPEGRETPPRAAAPGRMQLPPTAD